MPYFSKAFEINLSLSGNETQKKEDSTSCPLVSNCLLGWKIVLTQNYY